MFLYLDHRRLPRVVREVAVKSSFLVGLYLSIAAAVSAENLRTPRPLDPLAAEAFEQAVAGSPLVRELVHQIEGSNLVVHIESSRGLPAGVAGTMRFVTSRGGFRYVRIQLAAELRPETRAAILGHELQHACELAASDAHDMDAVRRLYQSAGHHPGHSANVFETQAAILVERQVKAELRADPSRQEAPSRQVARSRQGVPSRQDR